KTDTPPGRRAFDVSLLPDVPQPIRRLRTLWLTAPNKTLALTYVCMEPNPSKRPHNATLLMKIWWLHNFSVSGQKPL
ncbi:hypothetical protein, partial [Pseudomonas savastanoi]|uniref:hypothetical protein n=1 Tax=Pseudomonas savastanoi TaxID=29438 RepID=UPI001C814B49